MIKASVMKELIKMYLRSIFSNCFDFFGAFTMIFFIENCGNSFASIIDNKRPKVAEMIKIYMYKNARRYSGKIVLHWKANSKDKCKDSPGNVSFNRTAACK